jgi:4-methylaminobutanoate oxidase (formaldehyde-forming)
VEADLTIMQLDEGAFYIVTGSGFGLRDAAWIRRQLPKDGGLTLQEVTSAWSVINICGPKARRVLQSVSDDDLSNAAFPFFALRDIEIGQASLRAARIGYVGELGWELHIPTEYALYVYEMLRAAGEAEGIIDVGYRAIESLRLEKGYLYWSADLSPEVTPLEAGLGFCVAFDKGDFLGREALLRQRQEGVSRKLCGFSVDGFAPFFGGEAILREGKVIGLTTSGGYGHCLGKALALGYLPLEHLEARDFTIEAFGRSYSAVRGPRTLYDPANTRLKD